MNKLINILFILCIGCTTDLMVVQPKSIDQKTDSIDMLADDIAVKAPQTKKEVIKIKSITPEIDKQEVKYLNTISELKKQNNELNQQNNK